MVSVALAAVMLVSAPAEPSPQARQLRMQALQLAGSAVYYLLNWNALVANPQQARAACEQVLQLASQGLQVEQQAWQLFMRTRRFSDFYCAVAVTDYVQAIRWTAAALHLLVTGHYDLTPLALGTAEALLKSAGAASDIADAVP